MRCTMGLRCGRARAVPEGGGGYMTEWGRRTRRGPSWSTTRRAIDDSIIHAIPAEIYSSRRCISSGEHDIWLRIRGRRKSTFRRARECRNRGVARSSHTASPISHGWHQTPMTTLYLKTNFVHQYRYKREESQDKRLIAIILDSGIVSST